MHHATRPQHVFSLEQAAQAAPSLAALQARVRQSEQCMACVKHLIPAPMRAHVKAGPIDENGWCLLVSSAAASSKLRQLQPALLQALAHNGLQVSAIRIKVQTASR
jgi:hypothetical protein